MKHKTLKYFSTVIVCAIALCAGWWLWNYYMQSPWTRDGKVRAELVNITPEVSGRLEKILVHDNQFVSAGSLIFSIDPVPYQIALDNAEAALAKAQADMAKADHEAARRRSLPRNVISSEDLDESNLAAASMKASYKAAQANLEQAKWNLSKTRIYGPNRRLHHQFTGPRRQLRTAGTPLVALVDIHSFYVLGLFRRDQAQAYQRGSQGGYRVV
ncbi:Multidrug resistance protein MdtE precursor [Serratia fonticola]|uniref:Multidrug resistance protein MdtE n=1 Tax=Serratia fonticola TaxID=47917 RepID=A0A4U9WGQ7_SERFO|nr:Multidrug resistance protein MdtE precursor [Serratia fonticola]